MIVPSEFATTYTTAGALAVGSATLVARTVSQGNAGRAGGAVYTPLLSTIPKGPEPPVTPFTDQLTFVLLLLITAAAKFTVLPNNEVDFGGNTLIRGPEEPVPLPMLATSTASQIKPIPLVRLGGFGSTPITSTAATSLWFFKRASANFLPRKAKQSSLSRPLCARPPAHMIAPTPVGAKTQEATVTVIPMQANPPPTSKAAQTVFVILRTLFTTPCFE